MARVRGRYDDMLIIRGVNLYPSEVERVLLGVGDVAPHYQLIVDRPGALDELTVLCEPASDTADSGSPCGARIEHALREATGLSMLVQRAGAGRGAAQRRQSGARRRQPP